MYFLYHFGEQATDVLFWQLLRWCAFVVERSRWSQDVTTDPFDAPAVSGSTGLRARRIPVALKEAVAEEAASGKVGRSARSVIVAAQRFKGVTQLAHCGGWGGKWREIWLSRYLNLGRTVFRQENERVLSLAMDGVRISGMDALISTVFSPHSSVAMWLPPMVTAYCIMQCWRFARPSRWPRVSFPQRPLHIKGGRDTLFPEGAFF